MIMWSNYSPHTIKRYFIFTCFMNQALNLNIVTFKTFNTISSIYFKMKNAHPTTYNFYVFFLVFVFSKYLNGQ